MTMDSTIGGIPLKDEPLGALTLGGFLREVCDKYARREAVVFHPSEGPVQRLTYEEVLEEAFTVARALVARGVTKETRVGLLASCNRRGCRSFAGPCASASRPQQAHSSVGPIF